MKATPMARKYNSKGQSFRSGNCFLSYNPFGIRRIFEKLNDPWVILELKTPRNKKGDQTSHSLNEYLLNTYYVLLFETLGRKAVRSPFWGTTLWVFVEGSLQKHNGSLRLYNL